MRLVVKTAGDQDVEPCIASLARRQHKILSRDSPKLRAYKNTGPLRIVQSVATLEVVTLRANVNAGPRNQSRECNFVLFVRLLNAGRFKIV